jgi:nicotinate phosphoribosyltransferase
MFGVGTRLDVSVDAPYLDCIYKLQEYAGRPRRKRSTGKATWPGRKQVFRDCGPDGVILADTIALVEEPLPGRPMLVPVMRGGRRLVRPTLAEIRAHAQAELSSLPAECRRLRDPDPVVAAISDGLRAAAARVDREFP